MKSLFIVPILNSNPDITMNELYEYIDNRIRDNCGYTCIGNVPETGTCLLLVDTGIANLEILKNNPKYLWVEDLNE